MYLHRDIEKTLLKLAESFQVITIYGPRQVGKTTTVDYLFGDSFNYVTLDDADELAMALNAPKSFFALHPWPLIIDEVRKAPVLLSEIKIIVDEQRRKWMRANSPRQLMFVLTGSNQFELQDGISESLAGRTAIVNMSSMTGPEKAGTEGHVFDPDIEFLISKSKDPKSAPLNRTEIFKSIFNGGMPDIVSGASERSAYLKSYVDTYIEKDVRKLISADKEMQFRTFLSLIALRTGQELKYNTLSSDAGISAETCKRWLSILETSGIVIFLQPYMANASKRIIKSPKLYFTDTGLCSWLCRIHSAEMLEDSPLSGAIFETYVVSEITKSFYNSNLDPKDYLYYYRDTAGKEIDIVYVNNGEICPIEIKRGINPSNPTRNFSALEQFGMSIKPGLVIDNSDRIRALGDSAFAVPAGLIGM